MIAWALPGKAQRCVGPFLGKCQVSKGQRSVVLSMLTVEMSHKCGPTQVIVVEVLRLYLYLGA